MPLDPLAYVALLALLLVAALLLWWLYRSRRTSALRDRFGAAEYDRTLGKHGARGKAEAALIEREKRVAQLELRPIDMAERERLSADWHTAKARFVDDPAAAVSGADGVIGRVMRARGYPVDDFDARYESLTVDHSSVAGNYRAGREIASRAAEGGATTEELRQAMIHFEALFGELLSDDATGDDKSADHPSSRKEISPAA
jgi:hypothetical protein